MGMRFMSNEGLLEGMVIQRELLRQRRELAFLATSSSTLLALLHGISWQHISCLAAAFSWLSQHVLLKVVVTTSLSVA